MPPISGPPREAAQSLRLLPGSLWLQTLLVLAFAVAATAAVTAPVFNSRQESQLRGDLERRGHATVATLAKDYELRLAISLKDSALAEPILKALVRADDDVRYIAILKGHELVAVAPPGLAKEAVHGIVEAHLGQAPSTTPDLLRFTEKVVAQKTQIDLLGEPSDGNADALGFVILGLSTQRLSSRALQGTLGSVATTSLLVFTVLILFYFRWVARRLNRMVAFAQVVAGGVLHESLEDPAHDDLGRLAEALRSMAGRTGDVIVQLIDASRSLAAASTELLDSSTHQARSANEQATSVAEMGATVAELRQTFNEATSKAESVIDLARRSEESSSGGEAAVKESIDGIVHIRDQVAAIAQTIHGLLDRTDQINAIIEVVNDLAEQSNILALNAGIEAARAGEHGRGFAVVAREVRSLSERSKESTSEVRAILQDIRQAGRDAVRVIEEGSRRAENGVTLANAAGESIQRLGDTIVASSAAAMQIATITRQQSVGIDQIWQATKGIDQIARETAKGITQLEAAAGNMKGLSTRLTEIVGRYKV
ncbi:MAG TPA: methyl-accepting chemotaxis protein [Pseudomonadota bacterium]|nr:methyl-accepting chemotaxis protein [Pseudomonadota bacterium]